MKGGHKEDTKINKKSRFVALMEIRHIQKYEYIPDDVRESNLQCGDKYEHIRVNVRQSKCGNDQAQMKDLYANFERKSMKQERGHKI